ncbi:hypothetical protein E2493_09405 [Sphingomonas parva]|uniref:PLD phosphodiesterase domain-containing protein n=1 Tax=Sphingomonas parva TaxID=2555898 RepID=A0A4Y8ZU06_9SPHN|nr:phospholipase D family protein [Sphingomonas parva]TFI58625.1 hypothetical protein E2493_09405 [Sphingomonas parva]
MILEPQRRTSIYDLLRPPEGFGIDALVACTYSASLETVLSLPAVMLADLTGRERRGGPYVAADLAALRRVCDRTLVFCQAAAIHPAAMLPAAVIETERMVHEVTAPAGGAFHPKVWVARYVDGADRKLIRVAVMSRNLTGDSSWDAGLIVEGPPGRARQADCEITLLLQSLPGMCLRPLSSRARGILAQLAGEVCSVGWRLPSEISSLRFHTLGTSIGRGWTQPPSDRLLVISPFLTSGGLKVLAKSSEDPFLLVSRPNALDRCWPAAKGKFARQMVLSAPVLTDEANPQHGGLHAKILGWESRGRVRMAMGSMNATGPAMDGSNVEFLASFDCTKAFGAEGLAALLDGRALGTCLVDYEPPQNEEPSVEPDYRPGTAVLSTAGLHLRAEATDGGWSVALMPVKPLGADLVTLLPNLRFRLATTMAGRWSCCGEALAKGEPAQFVDALDLAEVTGFVVFETTGPDGTVSFTLNLEVLGVDEEERRQAVVRATIPTRRHLEEFLRGMLGDSSGTGGPIGGDEEGTTVLAWSGGGAAGLLEALVRCASDDPPRLQSIKAALDALGTHQLESLAPKGFLPLWEKLLRAVESKK